MARSRRTRASRAFITFVIIAIALGAVLEFYRAHQSAALAKTVVPIAAPKADAAVVAADVIAPRATVPVVPVNALVNDPTTRPASALTPVIWNTPKPQPPAPPMLLAAVAPAPTIQSSSATPPPSTHPLVDITKIKPAPGDLLSTRKSLNDALLSGSLSSADIDSVKKQISDINQTLIFSPKHFADDPFGGIETVKPGQRLSTIAAEHVVTWELLLRLNNMTDPRKLRANQTLKFIKGPFHVIVTKSKFTMDVYLGSPGQSDSMYVTTYMVGLGRDDSTPTGAWMVEPHHKITHPTYYSPRGDGVIQADDPKNPLGPYWIGLTGTDGHAVGKSSYGIHGTIEPDSIGKMASMGCIRMHNEDVALVYEMLVEGKSTVIVRD